MIKSFEQFINEGNINEGYVGSHKLFACGYHGNVNVIIDPTPEACKFAKQQYNSVSGIVKTACKVVAVGSHDDETVILPVAKSAATWKQEVIKKCQALVDYHNKVNPGYFDEEEIELDDFSDEDQPELPMTEYILIRNNHGALTAQKLFDAICQQLVDSEYNGDSDKGYVLVDLETGDTLLGNSIQVYITDSQSFLDDNVGDNE